MRDQALAASVGMSPRKWEIACSIVAAFAKRGYHGVGMRELAADLKLNQGTLYHHFPSKDEALLAICLVGQAEVRRYFSAVMARCSAFDERIGGLLAAHLEALASCGDFIDVYASQWTVLPLDLALPLREGWRLQKKEFEALFADAIARGEIPPNTPVRDAIRVVLAMFRTVNILHRTGRASELEAFAAFAARTLVAGMANPAIRCD